jgi:lipid-binding SYLF domain-containing protein
MLRHAINNSRHILILTLMFAFLIGVGKAADENTQADITKRLSASGDVLNTIMNTPNKAIPSGVMQRAVCVAVFPSTVQVAVLVGGKHGKGFATCRTGHGWSAPAPLDITGGSWGAQLGGEEVDLVMVITDEKGKEQLISGKSNLGTETSVTAGPVGNNEWKLNEDVLTYSRAKGVFAGTNLTGSSITEDQDDVRSMYGGQVSLSDILDGGKRAPPESQPLLNAIGKYAGRAGKAN